MKAFRRQNIVNYLLAVVKASEMAEKAVSEDRLVALCCMQFFCGERLVKEIIKHLKLTDQISEEYGELFITKHTNSANPDDGKKPEKNL